MRSQLSMKNQNITSWYDSDTRMAEMLDSVIGEGNWQIAGRNLETRHNGTMCSYYRVKSYTSGRLFIYDPHKI